MAGWYVFGHQTDSSSFFSCWHHRNHRLIRRSLTLIVISALLFGATNLLPGDVAAALLGQQATPEALHHIRSALGLDQPVWLRYLHWLTGALHGDFGNSLASGRPVA